MHGNRNHHLSPIVITDRLETALDAVGATTGQRLVLPSSLDPADELADDVLAAGGGSAVLTPVPLGGKVRALLRRDGDRGRVVDLTGIDPASELRTIELPARIVDADALLVACDLDRVARRGPYVLDVLASHASTSTRLRLHASRDRVRAVAECWLAVRADAVVLALTMGDARWYIATPDLIAGELVALALSERARGVDLDRSTVGPWEDPVVQRATELQLGALLPDQLEVVTSTTVDGLPAAGAIARQLTLRLGIASERA